MAAPGGATPGSGAGQGMPAGLPRLTWGLTFVGLAGVSLFVRGTAIAPAVFGLGGLWLLVSLLVDAVGRAIAVRQQVSATHLTAGQELRVRIILRNATRLPVPWVWFEEPLPVHLESTGRFRACGAIPAAGTCTAEFALRPSRRGRYRIGSIRFRLGDWFGLCTSEGQADLPLWVTVYPPIVRLPSLAPRARVPEGPRLDAASPFREQITQGLRRYAAGDPQRFIAWKASARHGELLVREFPRVWERATTVVLDLEARAWSDAGGRQALERAFSVAASFFWEPPDGPQATGLFTHAASVRYVPEGTGELSEPARLIRVAPRRGLEHRRRLLETLAVLRAGDGPALEDLLLLVRGRLTPGEAVLVLTAGHRPAAWAAAAQLAARHHPVTILGLGARTLPACPGVLVLPVSLEGEVRWG